MPDVYQGTEFWDHTLTDPDNRRPVDYAARRRGLTGPADWPSLLAAWPDGRVKQALLRHALALRRQLPELFAQGSYQPLALAGAHAQDALAYLRSHGDDHALIVVPLRCPGEPPERPMVPPGSWEDTAILLPARLGARTALDVLTQEEIRPDADRLRLASVLARTPVGLLRLDATP